MGGLISIVGALRSARQARLAAEAACKIAMTELDQAETAVEPTPHVKEMVSSWVLRTFG